jgi:RNA polymerase sigma-70 factor (ECF subfamily)
MSDHAERLCERARSGELSAASELVNLFYKPIYAYFRRQSTHDSDAADLTQKTFFKVWLSLSSYEGRSSFSTWLHAIAYHVLVDWRRSQRSSEPQSDEWWANQPADQTGPFEEAADRELAGRLHSLVETLEDDMRETVHLHYYQGLSLSETAEVLGIAASTVKYRLRSAIEFLKAQTAEPGVRIR